MTRTDIRVRQSPDGEERRGSRNVGFILYFSIQLRLSGLLSFSYLSFCADSKDHDVKRLYCQCVSGLVEQSGMKFVSVYGAAVIVTRCGVHWHTVVRIGIQ
jgi:hypothetical protein